MILTTICFPLTFTDILKISNELLKPLGIQYHEVNEIFNTKFILLLLKVLAGIEISNFEDFDEIIQNFRLLEIALFLNPSSFESNDHFIFLIQIQLIFEKFLDKKIIEENNHNYGVNEEDEEEEEKIEKEKRLIEKHYSYDNESIKKAFKIVIFDINIKQKFSNCFHDYFIKLFLDDSDIDDEKDQLEKYRRSFLEKGRIHDFEIFENYHSTDFWYFIRIFLNAFYITRPRNEIIERCVNLISFKDPSYLLKPREKVISEGTLYFLLKFYNYRNLKFSMGHDIDNTINNFYFSKIPKIIDDLQYAFYGMDNRLSYDQFFLQLQIIFDRIENASPIYYIIELLLRGIRKFVQIKVPSSDIILNSIKAKTIFTKSDSRPPIIIDDSNNQQENNDIDSQILSKNDDQKNTNIFNPFVPMKLHENEVNLIDNESEKFWNNSNLIISNFQYDNGVLLERSRSKEEESDFFKELKSIENKLVLDHSQKKQIGKKTKSKISKHSHEIKLYKLFTYDEIHFKWIFSSSIFNQLVVENQINLSNEKVPLIFYFNSDKNDLETLNINLISDLKSNLEDDEEISIYGSCEQIIPKNASLKQLFLQIHIPKSKEKNVDFELIYTQIYAFLSSVCNISIVILDFKHAEEQIDFFYKTLLISKSAYSKLKTKDSQNQLLKFQDDDEDGSEDDTNKDIGINNENTVLSNDLKIIFLIKSDKISFYIKDDKLIRKSSYLNRLSKKFINETKFIFINLKNLESYINFLDVFTDFCLISNSTIEQSKFAFESLNDHFLNIVYLHIKNSASWKEELNDIFQQRYQMLISLNNHDEEKSLKQLQEEISIYFPKFDYEIINECNSIIYKMKSNFIVHSKKIIKRELKKSSNRLLSDLSNKIKEKNDWSEGLIEIISNSHIQLLKNEFFNIVNLNFGNDESFFMIYEENLNLLEKRIKKDIKKINKYLKKAIENSKIRENVKISDFQNEIRKNTNYMLKETENIKEIKVSVEVGEEIDSLIEQDF